MDNQTFDITDDELLDVEKLTLEAIVNRSIEGLNVLGFGEIGLSASKVGFGKIRIGFTQADGVRSQVRQDGGVSGEQQAKAEADGLMVAG